MTKVPGAGGVERAIRNVKREIKGSLKQIHYHASRLLSRGNYAGAQALVEVARVVGSFEGEVEALREKWRSLRGGSGTGGTKGEMTLLTVLQAHPSSLGVRGRSGFDFRAPWTP
jgi:hypothetical protein